MIVGLLFDWRLHAGLCQLSPALPVNMPWNFGDTTLPEEVEYKGDTVIYLV